MSKIEQKIEEDNKNDNKILTDLDMIIHNLEKQQKASEGLQGKFMNKFSSNRDTQLDQQDDQAIAECLNLQKQATSNF